MSVDRAHRRKITCKACHQPGENRGYGWCVPCYGRWAARGRPESGPPAPYENLPEREYKPQPIPELCRMKRHPLAGDNLIVTEDGGWRCAACHEANRAAAAEREAVAWREQYDELHDGHDVIIKRDGRRFCRSCAPARARTQTSTERYDELHQGHDVVVRSNGWPYCRSCRRGDRDIDEIAVVRAAAGDPPGYLTPAEREAAILELRGYGLTYALIAERVGCSLFTAWRACDRNGLTTRRRCEEAA